MPAIGNVQDIDYAGETVARLTRDYAEMFKSTTAILERMRDLPKEVVTEQDISAYAAVIKDARDLKKRIEAVHEQEKVPFLRQGQGVDQTFFPLIGKLAKRNKGDPNGGIDICQSRLDDHVNKKRAEEMARRQAEYEEAQRKQREIERKAAEERQAQLEREAAAARARKAENIEAHQQAAQEHSRAAIQAEIEAEEAELRVSDAQIDLHAPVADMVRTRTESGAVLTAREVPFVQLIDRDLVNKELLWAHLKDEHIEMALKAWAKTTSHKKQMAGAIIEMRAKGQTR